MEKEHKTVIHIYSAFVASLVMQVLPSSALQFFGALLFLAVLIMAYILRKKADDRSLIENHMTYIIRTIWIWSLCLMVAMVAAVLWIVTSGGHNILGSAVDDIMISGMMPSDAEMKAVFNRFLVHNMVALIVTLGPCIIYIAYRLSKGLSRALKGHRIGNVKSWL